MTSTCESKRLEKATHDKYGGRTKPPPPLRSKNILSGKQMILSMKSGKLGFGDNDKTSGLTDKLKGDVKRPPHSEEWYTKHPPLSERYEAKRFK